MGVLNTLVEESLEGGHLHLENTANLGGAEQPRSPLLRVWRVVDSAPLDTRRVRARRQEPLS